MNTEDKMRAVMAASEKEAEFVAKSQQLLNVCTVPLLKSAALIVKHIATNPPKVYHAEYRELMDMIDIIYPAMQALVNFNTRITMRKEGKDEQE
jgi:hypothetical protein